MKIKGHRKVLPDHRDAPSHHDKSDGFDPLLDWDNLCKNVKNFWEDLFEDLTE
jgi:hypothetical protein